MFWVVYSETTEFKSIFFQNKNRCPINHFYNNVFWKSKILSEKIIIDNKSTTENYYDDLYKEIFTLSTNGDNLKLNRIKIQIITSMYMNLKCKYSDLVISTYTYFLDLYNIYNPTEAENSNFTEQSLPKISANIIKIFSKLKMYIVKMIIDLIQFKKIHPNLRCTDDTLLKSLITINLFLYHAIPKNEPDTPDTNSKINIKIVLAQMINLVERYSSKHCYIVSAYKFDEEIKDLNSKKQNLGDDEIYNFFIKAT